MKAILVIDVPSDYGDIADNKAIVAFRNGKLGTSLGIYNVPLKPMPEKKAPSVQLSARHNDEHMEILGLRCTDYEKGWNECIEELER